jgi:thiamine biosynthesis protein ThiS
MITVNGKSIAYEESMTVSDAISKAGEAVDNVTLVVLDNVVLPCGRIHAQAVADGASIKLLRIISGG